jgi:hypothetical protein
MSTTVATPVTAPPRAASSRPRRVKGRRNYLGGFFGWVWLAIIIIPVYYIVVTTFKDQGAYFTQNPLALPNPPTLTAYQQVVEAGIIRYFFNSVIVTVGAVIPLVLFSFLASYAIVRGTHPAAALQPKHVPARSRHPAAGHDHPHLFDHHPDPHVRHTGGADLALDRLRNPAHGADLEQLHPRRTPRAVRINATRRMHRLADGMEAGVPADQTGNRDRQHL